jgi:hypothetical protein
VSVAFGASRLVLALVLGVAAAAKLADREGTRQAAGGLGVPQAFAGPLAVVLPLVELALAAALVPAASARPAAAATAALLAGFVLVVGVALARGRRPGCNCFGRLHSAPIGPWTLARNVALATLAGLVAWRAAPLGRIEATATVGAVALVAQAWLWLELLRRYGRALQRVAELEGERDEPAGPETGGAAPPFVLPDLEGTLVPLESLLGPDGLVLLFTDPRCGACDLALEEAGELPAGLVAITTGPRDEATAKAEQHGLPVMLLDERLEVGPLYGVRGFPTAVRMDANGAIGETVIGHAAVASLLHGDASPRRVAGGVRCAAVG